MYGVSDVSLVWITLGSVDEYLSVSLVSGRHLLVDRNGMWQTVIGNSVKMTLNDAEWHQLDVALAAGFVSVDLRHDRCSNCSAVVPVNASAVMTSLGATVTHMQWQHSRNGFVGCMRDIRVNSDWLTRRWLAANPSASANVTLSCEWRDNCKPDPCSGRGVCTDMWTHSTCDCRRPFYGPACTRGIDMCYLLAIALQLIEIRFRVSFYKRH